MADIAVRSKRFEELLAERGLTTNLEAAELIKVNDATISRVRTGKTRPGGKFIAHALRAFPVTFDELFEVQAEEGDEL